MKNLFTSPKNVLMLPCDKKLSYSRDRTTPAQVCAILTNKRNFSLRNVPHLIFRKLPLDNFPHSAKYPRSILAVQEHKEYATQTYCLH